MPGNRTYALRLHVLASGSSGNAAIIEGPEGCILVDCGISRRALLCRANELGVDPESIRALILTHEHSDHVAGVSVWCKHFDGSVYATEGTMQARKYLAPLACTHVSHTDEWQAAGITVRSFPTSHDVADPIGLRFECDGDAIAYCTDTGVLGDEALECLCDARILALESNHDERMLATGPYPRFLKERVAGPGGHLSNAQAAGVLPSLIGERTEVVVGMHISQKNNRPSMAVRTLADALDAEPANSTCTEAVTPDGSLRVLVAGQDRPMTVG